MTTFDAHVITSDPWAFATDDLEGLERFYRSYGFAILTGVVDPETMERLERECIDAQERLVAGELPARHGTTQLIESDAEEKATHFANYVLHITELSAATHGVIHSAEVTEVIQRLLGPDHWSDSSGRFGYVYQDARPGRESSYTRIGWHSDWQSSPHLPLWPAIAVTVHVDATSPENGFLRVVPGSHLWATPAPYDNVNGAVVPEGSAPTGGYGDEAPPVTMPLRFEKVPGEVAVYANRGDILFHDCYLWHSASLATAAETRRRHVRGSYYAGEQPQSYGDGDFVKNAAR